MKREINTWNGSGWNNYPGLRAPIVLPRGARGCMAKQGIAEIRIEPYDSEKPFGIAVRYINNDGECIWTTRYDQDDTGDYIRAAVMTALTEGIRQRADKIQRRRMVEAFKLRISQWRRGFPEQPGKDSFQELSHRFHAARRAALKDDHRPSRSQCTSLARHVCGKSKTFADAKHEIESYGGIFVKGGLTH